MNDIEILAAPTAELLAAYRDAAIAYGDAIVSGRHRVANRSFEVLERFRKELCDRGQSAIEALTTLRSDEHAAVRLWAASHTAEYDSDAAIATLEALAADPPSPLSLMAQIALAETQRKRNG